MSERRIGGYVCATSKKRCYASRKEAKSALKQCRGQGRPERSWYYCEHCGQYHLTSRTARPKTAKQQEVAG